MADSARASARRSVSSRNGALLAAMGSSGRDVLARAPQPQPSSAAPPPSPQQQPPAPQAEIPTNSAALAAATAAAAARLSSLTAPEMRALADQLDATVLLFAPPADAAAAGSGNGATLLVGTGLLVTLGSGGGALMVVGAQLSREQALGARCALRLDQADPAGGAAANAAPRLHALDAETLYHQELVEGLPVTLVALAKPDESKGAAPLPARLVSLEESDGGPPLLSVRREATVIGHEPASGLKRHRQLAVAASSPSFLEIVPEHAAAAAPANSSAAPVAAAAASAAQTPSSSAPAASPSSTSASPAAASPPAAAAAAAAATATAAPPSAPQQTSGASLVHLPTAAAEVKGFAAGSAVFDSGFKFLGVLVGGSDARILRARAISQALAARSRALRQLVTEAAKEGRLADATRFFRLSHQLRPSASGEAVLRGLELLLAGQKERAVEELASGARQAPGESACFVLKGVALEAAGHLSDAITEYARVIELAPNAIDGYWLRGCARLALFRQTATSSRAGRKGAPAPDVEWLEAAARDLTAALQIQPQHALSFLARGDVYSELGKLDRARNDYGAALLADPALWQAHLRRSRLSLQAGDFDEAVTDCDAVLARRGPQSEALLVRGLALREKAKRDIALARQIDPSISDPFLSERA